MQFLSFRLGVAPNQAGCNRKEKTCREATHQDADDTFYGAQRSPRLRESTIRGADCRITGRGEVDSRFPSGKTIPAIEASPRQNSQHMHANNQAREPDYENGGTQNSKSVNAP